LVDISWIFRTRSKVQQYKKKPHRMEEIWKNCGNDLTVIIA